MIRSDGVHQKLFIMRWSASARILLLLPLFLLCTSSWLRADNSAESLVELVDKLEQRITIIVGCTGLLPTDTTLSPDSLAGAYTKYHYGQPTRDSLRWLWRKRDDARAGRLDAAALERATVLAMIVLERVESTGPNYRTVIRSGIPFYTDESCTVARTDVFGVALSSVREGRFLFPTTRPEYYKPGDVVMYQSSSARVWNDPLWYIDSATGKAGGMKSVEFVGRIIPPEDIWTPRPNAFNYELDERSEDPLSAGGQIITIARMLESNAEALYDRFGLGAPGSIPTRSELASAMVRTNVFERQDSIEFESALRYYSQIKRGGERNTRALLAIRDRLLPLVKKLPRTGYLALVERTDVPLFSDSLARTKRRDVYGLLLRIPGTRAPQWRVMPTTTPSSYTPMTFVSWEMTSEPTWARSWYIHPGTKKSVRAWDSVEYEFTGKPIGVVDR